MARKEIRSKKKKVLISVELNYSPNATFKKLLAMDSFRNFVRDWKNYHETNDMHILVTVQDYV